MQKLVIDASALTSALKVVAPAILPKTTMPILRYVKIVAKDKETCTITATNVNVSIIHDFGCHNKLSADEAILLPFDELIAIASVVVGPLSLSIEKGSSVIRADRNVYKIGDATDAGVFPKIPVLVDPITIEATNSLSRGFQNSTRVASQNINDLMFSNISLEVDKNQLTISSTDRHRLFVQQFHVDNQTKGSYTVPYSFIRSAKYIQSGSLSVTEKYISLASEKTQIIGLLSDQPFPNYRQIIPPAPDFNLTVPRADFISALNRVSVYKSATPYPTKFHFSPNGVRLEYFDDELNREATEDIVADHSVAIPLMGINVPLLESTLSCLPPEAETISFAITGAHKIVAIKCDVKEDNLSLYIMPYFIETPANTQNAK